MGSKTESRMPPAKGTAVNTNKKISAKLKQNKCCLYKESERKMTEKKGKESGKR